MPPADPLSLQAQTAYAELLDRLLRDASGGKPGSIVRKTIAGRVYVYAQHRGPFGMKQTYLGPDCEPTSARVTQIERAWARAKERGAGREELVAALRASRVPGPTNAETKVLAALADAGLFRVGGVLVGTHAFTCLGNSLGVRWEGLLLRTGDIDVAHDPKISVAIIGEVELADLERLTREPASGALLWPIPAFDPREPSTSFMVHGTELHVDLLAPLRGRPRGPVKLTPLGLAATPLRFLDYVLEETMPAAIVGHAGVLVNVPVPARFALHKLIVAAERSPHQATKANKDLAQAEALLRLLREERPADVRAAWKALVARGPGWLKRVKRSLARIDAQVARGLS